MIDILIPIVDLMQGELLLVARGRRWEVEVEVDVDVDFNFYGGGPRAGLHGTLVDPAGAFPAGAVWGWKQARCISHTKSVPE